MPTIDEQRSYYNDRWAKDGFANPIELSRALEVMRLLARIRSEMASPPKICDLGCGSGWITGLVGNVGPATGIDLSDVTEHRHKYPHCEFLSTNALEWNPPPESFDVVLSVEVIEHIEYPRQADYLGIARRALRPRGYIILTTPNRRTMEAFPGGGRTWSDQPVEDWLSAKDLRSVLTGSGFRVRLMTSLVPGFGSNGFYRVANSTKVNLLLGRLGLNELWTDLLLRAKLGLHLVALAQR
jgi:trans-aconitate methyltransferase